MSYKEHYKEKSPESTVAEIKQKLKEVGVDIEEHWMDVSEIDTHTVRVTIKGTNIGTNGKGVSREYAQASGYAEFMERLENDLLWGTQWFRNISKYSDSAEYTTEKLVEDNSSFLKMYFKKLNMEHSSKKKKIEYLEQMEILQKQILGKEGRYTCLPFYNVGEECVEYLPGAIYPFYYGSNGMCAGNSREEALVQGISEIVERYVQEKCFTQHLSFPDFPEDVIKKYPYIYDKYRRIKDMDGMEVWLKDCSMGGQYPVAALITLQKNTGRFGIKFGCHPIISIAMERTLTEATQGQAVRQFATGSTFDFTNNGVKERYNIENAMKVGVAQYPHQIFSKKSDFEYVSCKDYEGWSNKDILQDWMRVLMQKRWQFLIRNASYLNFHAYHIVVPGISEIREISSECARKSNTRLYASYLLKDMTRIDKDNLRYIVGAIEASVMSINENRLYTLFSAEIPQNMPASDLQEENSLFCCYAYFVLGEYDKSIRYVTCIINKAIAKENKDAAYYIAVKNYIAGYITYKAHEKVIEYLRNLFTDEIVERLNFIFGDKENIINKVYASFQVSENQLKESSIYEMNNRLLALRNRIKIEQEELKGILST